MTIYEAMWSGLYISGFCAAFIAMAFAVAGLYMAVHRLLLIAPQRFRMLCGVAAWLVAVFVFSTALALLFGGA